MQIPVTDLMKQRTSWRSYSAVVLESHVINEIRQIMSKHQNGPLGNNVKWTLVDREDLQNKRYKLGTYGFIRNARYFIAGQIYPGKRNFLDYGYLLESIILELTALGLGTCWLGGTFDRGEFSKAINLMEGHVIPAVTPVGYTSRNRSLGDRIIRTSAGSRNRKKWEELFFEDKAGKPLAPASHPSCVSLLEMVRIAPSASNLQPWRVVCHHSRLDFFLERKQDYQKVFGKVDIQMLDMGIAMCHFALTANEHKQNPVWEEISPSESVSGWEYIISATI